MPRFIVEQHIPNAGLLSAVELCAVAQQAARVLRSLGPDIQWVWSYVTDDRIYSLLYARDEALIGEYGRLSGMPANRVAVVKALIDPTTGEQPLVLKSGDKEV